MRYRIRSVLLLVSLLVVMVAPAASSQPPYPVYDYCLGVEHFPDEPIDGAPSRFGFYGSFGTYFGGGTFTFSYDGASGEQMGGGPIDSDGIGHGYGPLWSYGPHNVTGGTITMGGVTYDLDLSGLTFEVNDDEPECDGNDLSVIDNTPEEETTTTTEATTTTTEATTTTAEATTTTTEPDESPATSIQIIDEEGNSYLAWWVTGGILLVVGGGLFFFARAEEESCIPLKAAWLRAKKECDEAKGEVENRKRVLDEAREALKEAQKERQKWLDIVKEVEAELQELENARRSSVESGGVTYHRIAEGMVTAEGLEDIINSVKDRLQNAKDNVPDVSQSEKDWEQRVKDQEKRVKEAQDRADEKCKEAAAAKKAYEDCIKGSAGPDDADDGGSDAGDEGGTDGGVEGGTDTGTGAGGGTTPPTPPTPPTAPPTQPTQPGCTNGTTRNEQVGATQTFQVPKNTENLIITITPSTEDFDEWMEEEKEKAGGRFAPNKLLDSSFSGTIRSKLRGMDTSLNVSHSVRIEVPQQEITYECVTWEECVAGSWVQRQQRREKSRRDLSNRVFQRQGKLSSRDVTQLLAHARGHYQRLARNDEAIGQFCP